MKNRFMFTIVLTIIFGMVVAIYIYKKNKTYTRVALERTNKQIQEKNIINDSKELLKETNSAEYKTTPNTRIIEKKYYNECGHLVQNEEKIREKLINKNQLEFQIEFIGWEIQKFTPNEVVVYKEINDFCNEHYLVKDVEGEIIIYGLDKRGNENEVIRETGIETKYLSNEDIENLQTGIKIIGNKALNELIQDFE